MSSRGGRLRRIRLLAAATAAIVVAPAIARAHPRLTRSEPATGERVASVTTLIRLWFSEKPELTLTSITLTDGGGNLVAMGAIEREPDDAFGVRASFTRQPQPGTYTLTWRTAAADGHPVRGTFSFVVLPAAAAAVSTRTAVDTPSATPREHGAADSAAVHRESETAGGLLDTVVRAATFACLLVVIGAVVFQYAVLSRSVSDVGVRTIVSGRVAGIGLTAAAVLALLLVARLVLQVRLFDDESGTRGIGVGAFLTSTRWGAGWLVHLAAALLACLGFWFARRQRVGWLVAAAAALMLSVAPGLIGHAASSPRLPALAMVADAGHVMGASGWLGGLFVLVVVAIPAVIGAAGEARWTMVASLVNAFSPTALAFAALLVLTGVFAAWLHLGSLGALWSSEYGQTLLFKLAALLPLATTGAYNWRRVRPSLGTAQATTRLRRSAAVELSVAVLVICITAVLVAVPPPMDMATLE